MSTRRSAEPDNEQCLPMYDVHPYLFLRPLMSGEYSQNFHLRKTGGLQQKWRMAAKLIAAIQTAIKLLNLIKEDTYSVVHNITQLTQVEFHLRDVIAEQHAMLLHYYKNLLTVVEFKYAEYVFKLNTICVKRRSGWKIPPTVKPISFSLTLVELHDTTTFNLASSIMDYQWEYQRLQKSEKKPSLYHRFMRNVGILISPEVNKMPMFQLENTSRTSSSMTSETLPEESGLVSKLKQVTLSATSFIPSWKKAKESLTAKGIIRTRHSSASRLIEPNTVRNKVRIIEERENDYELSPMVPPEFENITWTFKSNKSQWSDDEISIGGENEIITVAK